jgi:hypothetical protein
MYNGIDHGYAHLHASGEQLVTEYRASDVIEPSGGAAAIERFVQPAGTNRPSRANLSGV